MSWAIGPADEADRGAIERLLSESDLPTEDLGGPWHESFLVARGGTAIIGTAGLEIHGEIGMLRSLATSARHRGRGIGSALLARTEDRASDLGLKTIYGLTVTAEEFLTTRGYEPIARSEAPAAIRGTAEFQTLCPESAVCLRKRIAT